MKLMYAGTGVSVKPYTALQFNCTRNQNCQRPFYVPFRQFSDISLYADLPGKPTLIEIDVYNVCDISNIGSAVSNKYVVGIKDDGVSWYAVFSSLTVTPPVGVTYHKFFFKLSLTIGGVVHVWYSQQCEFPLCEMLTLIKGCYPNVAVGADATDCNGLYYGFPTNEDYLGNNNFRYFHTAFLRMASIIEQNNKITFKAFNNKRIYFSDFVREYLFEFELVPTFYKDMLIVIFNRGNVQVEGTEWKLSETQNISITDVDSKLWKMDMLLDSECKENFGCGQSDCQLPPCCDVEVIGASVETIPDPPEPVCRTWTNEHATETITDLEYIDCNGDPQTDNLTPGASVCAFEITDPGTGGDLQVEGLCEGPAPCCPPSIVLATVETTG